MSRVQVSNEIIARCCAAIKLSEIFSPNVANVTIILQQSITAGAQWKALYKRTVAAIAQTSTRPWDHDLSPIFAHMDAFVQRCSDLLEVCDAQLQFAGQRPLPLFGGTRGEETKQIILDIQATFRSRVAALAGRTYDILDVKITRWHDDFNVFKAAVKDLEELLIKATDRAIESVSCLRDRTMLIEALQVGFI
jgi:dynein heavy chain